MGQFFYSQNPRLVVCRRLKKCHNILFRLTEWSTQLFVRPISPCHPLLGIDRTYVFLPLESPSDLLHGFSMGDSQISGPISDRKLPITIFELQAQIGPPSLHYSATGPPSYDCYGQHCSIFRISTTGQDPSHAPSCLVVVFYSMAISPNKSTQKSHLSNKKLVKISRLFSQPNVRESLA